MHYLVVLAHPLSDSLGAHLASHVRQTLLDLGHTVEFENLYEQAFDPVLRAAERVSYYGEYDTSGFEDEASRLLRAEGLVLIFPTWWFSFPAILKGWFDRVWGPGISYDHASDLGPIKPRLTGLRTTLAITTLGAPWWVDRLILLQPVKRVLKYAILGACAPQSAFRQVSLYKSEKPSPRAVANFKERISKMLR